MILAAKSYAAFASASSTNLTDAAPDRYVSVREVEHETRRAAPPVVTGDRTALYHGGKRSPQHEVDAQRKRLHLENEVFSPAKIAVTF